MRHPIGVLLLIPLALLSACDTFTGELEKLHLVPDSPQYVLGQMAVTVLDNNAGRAFTYSSCGPALEVRVEGHWTAVDVGTRVCTADLRSVAPGEVVTFRIPLPETLPAGTYRFVLAVGHDANQDERVRSVAFKVVV